jgi:UDP-N-acetylmuramyl pentapeptide phosphotransferase/UDP-N-acetylglucosamine-1-phosphate transferase
VSRARPAATAAAATVAAAGARAAYALLRARPPGGARTWTRTNHRGEDVTLLAGPAVAAGGIAGAALAPAVSGRYKAAMIVAGAGAAAFGGYDDLAGDGASKGFRGHLGALRRGEVTTGAVKLAGIGGTGFAAALLVAGQRSRSGGQTAADVIIDAGLIAGGANLLNLFDLRPGRAIKVAAVAGGLLPGPAGTELAAAPLAAALALLPEDLGERAMLGDAGANALGAMLGVAATSLPRPARLAVLAGIAGLTAVSERVSFTAVIERSAPLRWLDMLGRRPAAAAVPARPAGAAQASGAGRAAVPGRAAKPR